MQELQKKMLWLASKKSEFPRREVMEQWKDLKEEPFDKNWPRRASFDLEGEGTVPELFSRKKSDFQARYERQKVPYAKQADCGRKRSECDDEDNEESKQMRLHREYRCFYCKETGHIVRNCQLKSRLSNASVCEDKTSEEDKKKRTSEVAFIDEEKKISEYTWVGDFLQHTM